MNNVPQNPTKEDLSQALRMATDALETAARAAGVIPYVTKIAYLRALLNNAECGTNWEVTTRDREMRLSLLCAALANGKATIHSFDRKDFAAVLVGSTVYCCELNKVCGCPVVSDRLVLVLNEVLGLTKGQSW